MGVEVSVEDRDAYLHVWLVVGHLLGIDYDLLRRNPFNKQLEPLTYFEMQLLSEAIFRRQAAPSPSGQILTRALLDTQEKALPRALRPLPPAAIRRFLGDDAANMLDVAPAGPVRVMLGALGPLGSAADWIARGRVMRPRLGDMTTQLLRQFIAEQPDGSAAWSVAALDPALRLTPGPASELSPDPGLWEARA